MKKRLEKKDLLGDTKNDKVVDDNLNQLLGSQELQVAKGFWVAEVQQGIIQSPNFKSLCRQLDLFEDEYGLIRCGSRLKYSDIDFNVFLHKIGSFTFTFVGKAFKSSRYCQPIENRILDIEM